MIEILTGDFRELSQDLADDSVDLMLTDPPYPKEFLPLWEDLGRVAARVLKPGRFLISYSGSMFLPQVMEMLNDHLTYYWLIGLYHAGANTRIWARYVMDAMKPVLVYAKDPLRRNDAFFVNLLKSPAKSKEYHKWGQNIEPVRYLIDKFSKSGDLVFDPFLGGGTTAVACLQTNRRFVGHEIDPDKADDARRRVTRERLFTPQHDPVQLTIDAIGLPRCKFCFAVLNSNGGPGRKREYCDDLCRLRAFRFKQAETKRNSCWR